MCRKCLAMYLRERLGWLGYMSNKLNYLMEGYRHHLINDEVKLYIDKDMFTLYKLNILN